MRFECIIMDFLTCSVGGDLENKPAIVFREVLEVVVFLTVSRRCRLSGSYSVSKKFCNKKLRSKKKKHEMMVLNIPSRKVSVRMCY